MAFSLFNSGAAQAYANSFSPWKANGGYDKVKSEIGKDIFTQIPFLNFQAEVEMAKAGLAGYTGATKQKMVTDSNERIVDAKIDAQDRDREDWQKENRKGAIAKMLSGAGGGGAARAIANRGGTAGLKNLLGPGGDPLVDANAVEGQDQQLTARAHNYIAPAKAAVQNAIAGIPQGVKSSGGQVQLTQPTVQPLQVAPQPSVSSGKSEPTTADLESFVEKKLGGS